MPGCVIPSCRNSRRMLRRRGLDEQEDCDALKVSYFKFPSDPEIREKWKSLVPRPGWELSAHDRLCSDHFAKDCIVLKRRLITVPQGRKSTKIDNDNESESKLLGGELLSNISPEKTPLYEPKLQYMRLLKAGSVPTKSAPFPQVSLKKLELLDQRQTSSKPTKFIPEDKKIDIKILNPYLCCVICSGYFVNPVTITECLHTFCRSCLIQHFYYSVKCPCCQVPVHPTDPMIHVRYDTLKQDILNRLLPHVEIDEDKREISFYEARGLPRPIPRDHHKTASPDGESSQHATNDEGVSPVKNFYPRQALVSLDLEYAGSVGLGNITIRPLFKKLVRVVACVTILQVKSFIKLKMHTDEQLKVDIFCANAQLDDDFTAEFITQQFYQDDPDAVVQLHYVVSRFGLDLTSPQDPPPTPQQAEEPPTPQQAEESKPKVMRENVMDEKMDICTNVTEVCSDVTPTSPVLTGQSILSTSSVLTGQSILSTSPALTGPSNLSNPPVFTDPSNLSTSPVLTSQSILSTSPAFTDPRNLTNSPAFTEPSNFSTSPVLTGPSILSTSPVLTGQSILSTSPVITGPCILSTSPVITGLSILSTSPVFTGPDRSIRSTSPVFTGARSIGGSPIQGQSVSRDGSPGMDTST